MLRTPIHICFVISLCLSYWKPLVCQTPQEAFEYASVLYESGDYEQSSIELRRILFHSEYQARESSLLLANCYLFLNKPDQFIEYFKKAMSFEDNDTIRRDMKMTLIRKYIGLNQPIYALLLLNELSDSQSDKESLFYFVAAHYLLGNFNESEKYMHMLAVYIPEFDSEFISSVYRKAGRVKNRNLTQYAIYSAIVPGSGQMLNGAYQHGVDAFVLNTTLFSLAWIMARQLSFLDAFLSLYPFVQRYYLSNITTAKTTAELRQEEMKYLLYNQLLDYINNWLNPERAE